MELLDTMPMGTFAPRFYSLPAAAMAVGSLWAWLAAALAGAVGLWSIRAVGYSKPEAGSVLLDANAASPPRPAVAEPQARGEPAARAEAPPSEPSTPSKVPFTAYYCGVGGGDDLYGVEDGVKKCTDQRDDEARDGEEGKVAMRRASRAAAMTLAAQWEESEMAVRRRGDLGWYRYQDMAALDGSVVRLWDGEVTAAVASPRRMRRRAGWELQVSL